MSVWLALSLLLHPGLGDDHAPTRQQVQDALKAACTFFNEHVAVQGGYSWRMGADLKLAEGEDETDANRVWVQPPGTPTVGEAYLDAYDATGDPDYLAAARKTGEALVRGQLRSGGWDYDIVFDAERRRPVGYRDDPAPKKAPRGRSNLDDDTTQAALRFLTRLDQALGFRDPRIHDATLYGLNALLAAQYPNGGWYAWWREFPKPAAEADYPVLKAGYPESWDRQWKADYPGVYVINDGLLEDVIETLLRAHEVYHDGRYLDAARKAGDFLILAQMPEPQPAWAQQYNREMHPAWSRKFEPPAVTGGESQGVLRALLRLYQVTGDARYLEPFPSALAYLQRSVQPDGRLARFYELQTNRPLFFTRDYALTNDPSDSPTHYSFLVDSQLESIEALYQRAREHGPDALKPSKPGKPSPAQIEQVRAILAALDDRGAWAQPGNMRGHDKAKPPGGILASETFARNVRALSQYLKAQP